MELFKHELFNYEPLSCNGFITNLPDVLGVNNFEILGCEVIRDIIRNKINVEVIESKTRNVAEQFKDIDIINDKLGNDSFIEINYLDKTGVLMKTEKYTNVRLVKTIRKFPNLHYGSNRLITTILQFSFLEIEDKNVEN